MLSAKWLQSFPTLCDPRDGSPPGSTVPGILQARTLEWVAISFSRGSSQPRDRIQVSRIVGRHFTIWATREVTSRGISQLQIPPHQEEDLPKRDCCHPKNSPAWCLRLYRVWIFFKDCETFFNLAGGIYPETTCLIQDGSSSSLFRDRRFISCLFWSATPAKLCWLFRAVLRNLIPRNLILGVFIKMALICSSE